MSGKTQIDIVHVLGWMGNLSRTLVIRREIGRFKNRETKPSWGLLIRSLFSSSFDMSCSAVLQCRCPNVHNSWRQREAEIQALVRCIIPSVMVNCHCLAFSGFRPIAMRLRFCFCCSWLKASTVLLKEALILLSANSSTSAKRLNDLLGSWADGGIFTVGFSRS